MDRKLLSVLQMDRLRIQSPPVRTAAQFAPAYRCEMRRPTETPQFETFRSQRVPPEWRSFPGRADHVQTRNPLKQSKRDSVVWCKRRVFRVKIPVDWRYR